MRIFNFEKADSKWKFSSFPQDAQSIDWTKSGKSLFYQKRKLATAGMDSLRESLTSEGISYHT